MISHYFQRNSGPPLLIKIAALFAALYIAYLLLKVFAVVLTALFSVVKVVLLVALILLAASFLLRVLFGINVFPFSKHPPYRSNRH